MTRAREFHVQLVDDDVPLDRLGPGWYEESSVEFDRPPKFRFDAPNPGGINAHILTDGLEVDIHREEERRFPGIIETVEPVDDRGDSNVTCWGMHVGYKLMQAETCDSYDFDEDGNPGTTRDAVTINPWNYIIFRDPDGSLDALGRKPALTGVRPDEVMQCLIGTKFVFQQDFTDTRMFLPSTHTGTGKCITVWRDGQDDDVRPSLQLIRDGDQYKVGDPIETIPLVNGDKNITPMGDISTVTVEFIGEYDGTHDPTVEVCRNAFDGTRTYTSVSLTRQDNWNGTTLSRWTGTVDLSSDGATNKNALAAKINFTPNTTPTSTTSKVFYARFDAVTTSDTGISEGTLETYSNPVTFTDDGENWIETDLLTFNRMDAVERVRTMTESDEATNPSPHWDAWIDKDLDFHFKERRGSTVSNHVYSFENENLDVIRHRFFGGDKAYQTVAYGAGSGTTQTRIVSKTEFSNGGLYDSDRDPANGGDRHNRVMQFTDANEASATNLFRKARAFHKLHRDPIETFEVEIRGEHIRHFSTGDSIDVENLNTRTNDLLRVVRLRRKWDDGGLGEDLETTIGENRDDLVNKLRGMKGENEVLTVRPQPVKGTMGMAGNGIHFDKDHFGIYAFSIPDGSQVERVKLRLETVPWQSMAKSVLGNHDHGIPSLSVSGATSEAGGANLVKDTSIQDDLDMDQDNVGGQDMSPGDVDDKSTSGSGSGSVNDDDLVASAESQPVTVGDSESEAGSINGTTTSQGIHSVSLNTSSWSDLGSGISFVTGDSHIRIQVMQWNDAGDDHPTDMRVRIQQTGETDKLYPTSVGIDVLQGVTGETADSVRFGFVEVIVTNDQLQDPTKDATLQVELQSDVGSFTDEFGLLYHIVDKHFHGPGTYATNGGNVVGGLNDPGVGTTVSGTVGGGLTGSTDNFFNTPTGQMLASFVSDLLQERRVGYRANDGGTGSLLYSEGGNDYHESHEHGVTGQTTQADTTDTEAVSELDFGIYQYDGASGDGTGTPVYGIGIKFAVDPTVDANGIPTTFGTERVPHKFGERTAPATADIDITNFLERDSDNTIKDGPHKVAFKSEADGSVNPDGLAVVRATPVFEYKEREVVA